MALYTSQQFAELLGLDIKNKNDRAKFSVWKKRANIIMSGDFYDSEKPENKYWIEKHSNAKDIIFKSVNPSVEIGFNSKSNTGEDFENSVKKIKSKHDLDIEKKKLDIEKTAEEVKILKIREQKMRGEIIPIDLIKSIFAQHSQSILTEFKNATDNIVTIIAKKKGLNNNEVAEVRGQMIEAINQSVDKAVDLSKKNLNQIVSDFSLKRDIGQHD